MPHPNQPVKMRLFGRLLRDNDGEIRNKAQLSMEFHRRTGKMEQIVNLHMQDGLLVETVRQERT
ncbi:hypothetical protein Dalk_5239 [Desulfatibacillum aliphaticivorans]|uniref:Uncharacterized protein n=1 Tax=Desulfatibacillum aliphaticivorans TaxID=218208 RepID=B8FEC8_DESAL|nr:hypothetical protein [Desulfatibacillum aliphaticivorans]ACL06909.1 hypothetical protein Dalk_5239 [Desulfatibacillum aliphaticivorans]